MAAAKTHPRYCLRIYWPNPGSRDYFEHLSFATVFPSKIRQHRVDRTVARFVAKRSGNRILLDYRAPSVRAFNKRAAMELGFLRLTLKKGRVVDVEWSSKPGGPFGSEEAKWSWFGPPDPGAYSFSKSKAKRVLIPRALRDAQSQLKEQMLTAYGGQCCISGCRVAAALDAAHLDEAGYLKREHPRNSLLLRADLHRLLDADLLGIEPGTRKVRLATALVEDPVFSRLAGRVIRRPEPNWEAYGPDSASLSRKWKGFLRRQKEEASDE